VDSCLITLMADQSHTFTITSGTVASSDLHAAALTAAPVLRSVNDLVARS
jgi:beta-mannosidase